MKRQLYFYENKMSTLFREKILYKTLCGFTDLPLHIVEDVECVDPARDLFGIGACRILWMIHSSLGFLDSAVLEARTSRFKELVYDFEQVIEEVGKFYIEYRMSDEFVEIIIHNPTTDEVMWISGSSCYRLFTENSNYSNILDIFRRLDIEVPKWYTEKIPEVMRYPPGVVLRASS